MTAMMIEAAVRGLLLAIVVGAGLRVLRVTNVPARKAAWSLVLVASLAMPFLMRWPAMTGWAQGFGWVVPVHRIGAQSVATQKGIAREPAELPAVRTSHADGLPAGKSHLSAKRKMMEPTSGTAVPAALHEVATEGAASAVPIAIEIAVPPVSREWPPVERLIVWVYLAVSGALLLRLMWGLGAAVWLWARAEEISPLDVPEENVRVSATIPSPVTIGSGIVLPGNYRAWSRAKLRVVLAHERSHVRQMDFYLQLLAGIYAALFWFSPLGWWLKRALAHLGEAISDRAGVEAAASRSHYAGVLLEFVATTGRALPGVAMARKGNLSRRVEQLLNEELFRRAFAEGRRRAVVSLLLVPATLFAVTALVRVPRVAAQTETAPGTAALQAAAPLVQDPGAGRRVVGQSNPPESRVTTMTPETVQSPATPPPPQAAPAPAPAAQPGAPEAAPALEPRAPEHADGPMTLDVGPMPEVIIPKMPRMKIFMPRTEILDDEMPQLMALGKLGSEFSLVGPGDSFYLAPNGGSHGYAYYFSSNNGDSWAIVTGTNFSMGSGKDKRQLDLAQRMAKGPFLWFSHDGKSYIVDDAAVVARIQSLYAPMRDLGRQQEALGVQQGVIGRMQGELARRQRTEASVRIPDLSKEMADAEAALNSLKSEQGQMLSQQKLAEMQSKLAEMEAKLGSLEARSAVQSNFGERMRALGEQQRDMGEQQRQLGEQQRKLATQTQEQVQSIIQECLHNGKAAPVK
ncbi:MAG TPA: M56 family metallopeptidase [Acidobacteriaceae bacterium]|jgi:hypothetical protein|nr:M56 family metallopeptidase [Acidobacteriaceae bacterium]